jgi:PadR family transcriptional regulator, regulatory protein AphA
MSLAHAILGMLHIRPMTGYELKVECFDNTVAHFWQADQAQIYRTLDKLAEDGLVSSEIEIQTGRPNRKIYSLTGTGQAELTRWLHEPQPLPVQRQSFLVQLFFAEQLPDADVLAMLRQQLALHREQLARYQAIFETVFKPLKPMPRHLQLQLFTLNMGMQQEQAYIGWLEDCIRTVEGFPAE